MPEPQYLEDQRLPASYANFYVANGAVLVPVFGCPADDAACAILGDCFPGRRVVPIDCRVLDRRAWARCTASRSRCRPCRADEVMSARCRGGVVAPRPIS